MRATIPGDDGRVAVRSAKITFAGRRVRTDGRGRAYVTARLAAGRHRARAVKRGLRPGRATVRALRASPAPRLTG